MTYQHQSLASGGWRKLSFVEQMAHIGSEVERTILWQEKKHADYSQQALYRALELLSLTIDAHQKTTRLRELTRLKEVLIDYFIGENKFSSSALLWRKYFYPFNYAARLEA